MSEERTCKDRIGTHYRERMDDLQKLWAAYTSGKEEVEDLGNLYEYGLCFDYVAPGTFGEKQKRGYFRYQLCWGGPSDEFRFFVDENLTPLRVEYWFMDWYDGAKKVARGKDLALLLELWGWFKECGTVEAELKKAQEE